MRFQRSRFTGRNVRGAGPADLNFFPLYGQSLSLGANGTPVLSSTPSAMHKMFVDGLRPQYDAPSDAPGVAYASLVALVEVVCPFDANIGETSASGAADMVSQLLAAENPGITHRLHMSCPGWGSTSIADLSSYTLAHYPRLLQESEYGYVCAGNLGWTFAIQALGWFQGENDIVAGTARATYTAAMQTLRSNYSGHSGAAARQNFSVPMLSYQVASHNYAGVTTPTIALAQTDAESSAIRIVSAMYQYDYPLGIWHLSNSSYRWLGAYLGLAYKRVVIDGLTSWSGIVKITSAVRNGNGIDVTTDASGGLVLDTSWVSPLADGNCGFQVVDSGSSPVAVTGVTLTGPSTLRVACASGGGAGSKLRYGWACDAGATSPGRVVGPRGNVRDSYGNSCTFQVAPGDVRPMHRWLAISERTTT